MAEKDEDYVFPWGFHLGDLHHSSEKIPLYTHSDDGGFCLLYDDASEPKVDNLLESLSLQLLSSMPHESLKVDLFDFGKKKFYHLSPLQYMQLFSTAHNTEMMDDLFTSLEETIVSRYQDLLCCNRPTINAHNQKSKLKQKYHFVLINLHHFPTSEITPRRIQNFVESAQKAGVYVIPFGHHDITNSENKNIHILLEHFKILKVSNNEFEITKEIFEFPELLDTHTFHPLSLDKSALMQKALTNANLETLMNSGSIKLETNTKV